MTLSSAALNRIAEFPAYWLPPAPARWVASRLYVICYLLFARDSVAQTASAVQLTLAEPNDDSASIACDCFAAKGAQRSNYRAMARRKDWPAANAKFSADVYRRLADTERPLVILTVHQADYLAGLLAVLKLIPVEREIHIIKLAEWTTIEELAYQHFRKYGHQLVIHRLSERPAKKIVRALKKRAILVTFVDVPREFGTTEAVTMFDMPFRLTAGPLAMARLAGATVLPVFSNYTSNGACEIKSGTPIPSTTTRLCSPNQNQQGTPKKQSVAAMAQALASQIENNLKSYAAQWEMWPVISNLLDYEALAGPRPSMTPHTPTLARIARLVDLPKPKDDPTPG